MRKREHARRESRNRFLLDFERADGSGGFERGKGTLLPHTLVDPSAAAVGCSASEGAPDAIPRASRVCCEASQYVRKAASKTKNSTEFLFCNTHGLTL